MKQRRFFQYDVFSPEATKGNALAVVVDGDGLSDQQMQNFAAWTNLAETTFICTPTSNEADYKLRIFTPSREMLFAGHPTLGSCAAWLKAGGVPRHKNTVKQECGVGIVDIDTSDSLLAFIAPPTRIHPLEKESLTSIIDALGIDEGKIIETARLENGPVWQVIELETAKDVLAVDSSLVKWPVFGPIGLIGRHDLEAECDYEVRMLAPSSGMSEDPITGSLNAALSHWLRANNRLEKNIVIAQGTVINRTGRVFIKPDLADPSRTYIGGHTHGVVAGDVYL